jgi:hypothetical protein
MKMIIYYAAHTRQKPQEKTMSKATKLGAALAVGCSALLAGANASDVTTTDIKPWMWEKWQYEEEVEMAKWAAGFNAGIECLMLLDLELDAKGERKTWGEMADICRNRNNVADACR